MKKYEDFKTELNHYQFDGELIEGNSYLIFIDYFQPARNSILLDIGHERGDYQLDDQSESEFLKEKGFDLDIKMLFGSGSGLYGCVYDGTDPDYDCRDSLILDYQNVTRQFYFENIFYESPLVEGTLMPGIYQDWLITDFCRVKDFADLEIFLEYISDALADHQTFKAECLDGGLLISSKEGGKIDEVPRYPLDYFDVHCPFCKTKVVSCITAREISCVTEETPCPHFLGNDDLLDPQLFDKLKIPHRYEGKRLFVKPENIWQEAHVYLPKDDVKQNFWSEEGVCFVFLPENNGKAAERS